MSRMRLVGAESGSGSPGISILANAVLAVGGARMMAGIAAWLVVRSQLSAERIVVPEGQTRLGGTKVIGPISAFAEAEAIRRIALEATGGRKYGEMPEGDPLAETAMDAALLRSSLFTSILGFGMAAAEVATGAALVAVGIALGRLSEGQSAPTG